MELVLESYMGIQLKSNIISNQLKMSQIKNVYEERIVLFLDIMGFKELVKESSDNIETFNKIKTTVRIIRQTFKITKKTKERTITQFSDSIVVSFLISEKGEVAFLLAKTHQLIKRLILKDIICRGGIAKGKLIHDEFFLIGPAFINAYELESKIAIFPRVIISDQSIIKIGIENFGYHPANDSDYEKSEINSLIALDFDGFYYINYFSIESFWELSNNEKMYANKLRELIESCLCKFDQITYLKQKYEWMKDKFNEQTYAIKSDNRIEVGGIKIGSDKVSKFYKKLKPIEQH